MLVVLDAIDVFGGVEVVTVGTVVVIEDAGAVEGVTTVVGVLVDEQELMHKSAAIATPGRLNDRKGSLSPIDSRRGLAGLPPILGRPSKHTLRGRRLRRVFLSLHIHPDKGRQQPANATTLTPECQEPSNSRESHFPGRRSDDQGRATRRPWIWSKWRRSDILVKGLTPMICP